MKKEKTKVVMMKFGIKHSNALKFRANCKGINKSKLFRDIVRDYLAK